jgi:hypothetical protein
MACIETTLHLLCFKLKLVVWHLFMIFSMHEPLNAVTVNVFAYEGFEFKTCCWITQLILYLKMTCMRM